MKNISWIQWTIGILVSIIIAMVGYSLFAVDSLKESVRKEYVSQSEYNRESRNIDNRLNRMENKIDNIYEYLTDGPRKPKR